MKRIDNSLVRGEHKTKILKTYVLPASRFILTVHEIPKSNLDKLDALYHRYLKKWLGIPRCATSNILHINQFTDISTIKALYHQSHSTAHAFSRIKADNVVNVALDSKLQREQQWQRKFSIGVYAQNALYSAKSALNRVQASHLPTINRTIVKSIKEEVSELCQTK